MSLKEITKSLHSEAEKTEFMKSIMNRSITKEQYTNYLWQMLSVYGIIEGGIRTHGFFKNASDLDRVSMILLDFNELRDSNYKYYWTSETNDYASYILGLINDPDRKHLLKAHVYVHHLGTLNGGQFIAKLVPGSGKFYQFDNVELLREEIKSELSDDLGDEAIKAFEWAIKILNSLNG